MTVSVSTRTPLSPPRAETTRVRPRRHGDTTGDRARWKRDDPPPRVKTPATYRGSSFSSDEPGTKSPIRARPQSPAGLLCPAPRCWRYLVPCQATFARLTVGSGDQRNDGPPPRSTRQAVASAICSDLVGPPTVCSVASAGITCTGQRHPLRGRAGGTGVCAERQPLRGGEIRKVLLPRSGR